MTLSFSSLSGGTSFTVITSTGGSKTATLSKTFPAGTYLIESMAADTNLEIYLGASDGTQVGSCVAGAKSVTASASFLYVTTVNADTNDAVTFTLKSAATLATKTDAFWAPPTITDITPSGLPNVDDTTTITGTNFASNVEVKFRKSDNSTLVTPKTTVRGSATSIIAGRPDSFAVGDAPYDVIVTNPTTTLSATSLNAITSGAVPVWVTSTTLNSATITQAFSQTISATDADGGSSITYAIVSGALQTGLSLNTSTGAITGTPTGSAGSTSVVISATDSGGNAVNRTFTQVINPEAVIAEVLVISGGGGGGGGGASSPQLNHGRGGGGGAGGILYYSSQTLAIDNSYSVTVGAGGARGFSSGLGGTFYGSNGGNSQFGSLTASLGGGGGGAGNGSSFSSSNNGRSGGSGGGAATFNGAGSAGTGTVGQGNNGGSAVEAAPQYGAGGGGGAGGAGGNGTSTAGGAGGVGTSTYSSWGLATSTGHNVSGTVYYAGGGGGAAYADNSLSGAGGNGGGGSGRTGAIGNSASTNTGGGGGGSVDGYAGGYGGSGIVIVRYQSATQKCFGGNSTVNSNGYWYHVFTSSGTLNTTLSHVAKAIGGTVTTSGGYWIHTFTGSGTFTPSANLTNVDYLVVAGGGAGGSNLQNGNQGQGGGGSGGFRTSAGTSGANSAAESKININSGTVCTITVGSGGDVYLGDLRGGNGNNSSISGNGLSTITSSGGGGGAAQNEVASVGGSGGGGSAGNTTAANGTSGQGLSGGNSGGYATKGGGGGGAGSAGTGSSGGSNGGSGISSSISGSSVTYAGGGGGSITNGSGQGTPGPGGSGGGGAGSNGSTIPGVSGTTNTGGGGGGGYASVGGNGGSGIVIIRYPV